MCFHWTPSIYCFSTGGRSRFQLVSEPVCRSVLRCVCVCVCRLLTGGVCVSVPLLASRLRMLRSDICRRAAMGGTRDSVAGSRVTSAFMSLSSSSSWFNTAATRSKELLHSSLQMMLDGFPEQIDVSYSYQRFLNSTFCLLTWTFR